MATNQKLKVTGLCFQYYSYFPNPVSCKPRHGLLTEGTRRWHAAALQHAGTAGGTSQFGSNSLFSWHSPTWTVFHQERGPRASQEATVPRLSSPGHPTATAQALDLHQQTHRSLWLVQNPILFPSQTQHAFSSLSVTLVKAYGEIPRFRHCLPESI